jgi:hypothetical protein
MVHFYTPPENGAGFYPAGFASKKARKLRAKELLVLACFITGYASPALY